MGVHSFGLLGADGRPIPETPYELAVQRGLITGTSTIIARGHNPSQSAASGFVDVAEMGDLSYLSSAETVNVVSTSTSDAAAGAGLRTLLLSGVDGTGAAISETITMNGTTNVLSSNAYLRVNSMVGLTGGSTGWNVGDVTATASAAGTIQDEMDATESISQGSHYTVPLGKTLHVTQLELNAAKTGGGLLPVVEFKVYSRTGGAGAAWIQLFDKKMDVGVTDELDLFLPFPSSNIQATARTDLRVRSDTDQNSTEVRTRLYGFLIDD